MKPRMRDGIAAASLCAITLIAYANSFSCGFVFDNRFLLLENARIQDATAANVALIFNHTYWWPVGESGLYRPFTTLSYLFNYAILGNADRPAGYHAINLLLHCGNVLLVFALARRLVRGFATAFSVAMLWAVHPVLTESVTNMVGRADLLAGMSTLGGLLVYLKSRESTGARRLGWLAALMAITAVGVFSKESAVVVVAVAALYEFAWRRPDSGRGYLLGCAAMLPPILVLGWMRGKVLAASAPTAFPFVDNPIVGASFVTGRLTAIDVLARDLWLLVWPAHLSADYSWRQIPLANGGPMDWVRLTIVAAVAAVSLALFRRNKPVFFAAGFAFIAILPASNLIVPIGAIMAERFLYLPAVGFAVCLALALEAGARRIGIGSQGALAAALLIAAGFGSRTWARNKDWRDDLAFWSAAVETSPLSFKTHTILAETLHANRLDPDRAIAEDERSLALLGSLPDSLQDPGVYLRLAAEYTEKAAALQARDSPLYDKARSLLFRRLSILRAHDEANRRNGPALPGQPGDPGLVDRGAEMYTWLMLSATDQQAGKPEEALKAAHQAQAAAPMSALVYSRMHNVLYSLGRREDARAALMQGILLTSESGLERMLLEDYANSHEPNSCAISYADIMPAVDYSCAAVRTQMCAASADAMQVAAKAGRSDAVLRIQRELRTKYGCPVAR